MRNTSDPGSLAGKLQTEMETELSVGACNKCQWTTNPWDNQGHKGEEGREPCEWSGWKVSLTVSLLPGWKKTENRLCFIQALLNLQGLHSRSYFLLVTLLVYWYNLSARLCLLLCSPSYRLHTSISQTSLITSLCATERRIQQQEKWLSSSSQQKSGHPSGWQLVHPQGSQASSVP